MAPTSLLYAWGDSELWIKSAIVAGIIVGAYVLMLWVAMVMWTYRDAHSRTRSLLGQAGAVLLVLVFSLPGFLLYLALRPPEPLTESYSRQLEAEAFKREIGRDLACSACRRTVDREFVFCPHCTARLQTPCVECDHLLRASWAVCPYCSTARDATPRRRTRTATEVRRARPAAAYSPDGATKAESPDGLAQQPASAG